MCQSSVIGGLPTGPTDMMTSTLLSRIADETLFGSNWTTPIVLLTMNRPSACAAAWFGLFVTIVLWRNGLLGMLELLYTPTAMVLAQLVIAAPVVTEKGTFVGESIPRKEDGRLVQGQGVFVDDIKRHNMGYVHFVRSPYAHAKILSVDVSKALELDGVALDAQPAQLGRGHSGVGQRSFVAGTSPLPGLEHVDLPGPREPLK